MTEPGSIKQISSFIIFEVAQKAKPTSLNSNLSASQPTSWVIGGEQEGVSVRAGEPLHCCGCHHHQLTLTQ